MMKNFFSLLVLGALAFSAVSATAQEMVDEDELPERLTVEAVADAVAARIRSGIKNRDPVKLSDFAKRQTGINAEYAVMLKGVELFYNIHEAELRLRSLYEAHASAYVRWARSRENNRLDRVSKRDVSKALGLVEKTRLSYFRSRTQVNTLRFDFEDLTGLVLPEEFSTAPTVPDIGPPDFIYDEVLAHAKMSRTGRRVRRAVYDTLQDIADGWQAIIAARAELDYLKRELLYRQQIYQQDRATSLGSAMTDETAGEAALVQAIGNYRIAVYRLSVLLSNENTDRLELSRNGLDEAYPHTVMGLDVDKENGRYVPKSGSGFGQDDQP